MKYICYLIIQVICIISFFPVFLLFVTICILRGDIMALLDQFMKNVDVLSDIENVCFQEILKMDFDRKTITIQYLADILNVSTTTIYRMVKKLGYPSFKEFSYDLVYHKRKSFNHHEQVDDIEQQMKEQFLETLNYFHHIDINSLLECINQSHSILIASSGLNNYIAKILAIKLSLMGKKVSFPEDPWVAFLEASQLTSNDLLIAFSRDGNTQQILDTIKNAKVGGGKILLITQGHKSQMKNLADYVLICASEVEEGYNLDTRLQMHICINYLMKKMTIFKNEEMKS